MKARILEKVYYGFDLERPSVDLVFREPKGRWGIGPEKKAIGLRFAIGDDVEDVIRELRRTANVLEDEIK
jgi:hypothetical protein